MKAAPVPLFNYRKRPCQAILSGPQQPATSISALDASRSSLSSAETGSDRRPSTQAFSGSKQNVVTSNSKHNKNIDQRDTFPSMATTGNNLQRLAPNPVRQTNPGLMNVKGKFVAGGWGKSETTKGGTRYQFSHSPEINVPYGSHTQGNATQGNTTALRGAISETSSSNTGRRESYGATSSSINSKPTAANCFSNQKKASSGYSFSGNTSKCTSSIFPGNQGNQYELSSGYNKSSAYQSANSTCAEASGSFNRARSGQARQSQSNFRTQSNNSAAQWDIARNIQHKANNEPDSNNMDSVFKDVFCRQTNTDSHQKNRVPQGNQIKQSAAKDMSLRIFTCTIAMLRSWTAKRISVGLLMFEVYGVIDSAVVRDRSGTGKEFVLRDGTSTITCVFYEIDREIPRLIRGQMCRVVGSMTDNVGVLHVVSVRSVHADERLVCQAAIELSQTEMDKLAI